MLRAISGWVLLAKRAPLQSSGPPAGRCRRVGAQASNGRPCEPPRFKAIRRQFHDDPVVAGDELLLPCSGRPRETLLWQRSRKRDVAWNSLTNSVNRVMGRRLPVGRGHERAVGEVRAIAGSMVFSSSVTRWNSAVSPAHRDGVGGIRAAFRSCARLSDLPRGVPQRDLQSDPVTASVAPRQSAARPGRRWSAGAEFLRLEPARWPTTPLARAVRRHRISPSAGGRCAVRASPVPPEPQSRLRSPLGADPLVRSCASLDSSVSDATSREAPSRFASNSTVDSSPSPCQHDAIAAIRRQESGYSAGLKNIVSPSSNRARWPLITLTVGVEVFARTIRHPYSAHGGPSLTSA